MPNFCGVFFTSIYIFVCVFTVQVADNQLRRCYISLYFCFIAFVLFCLYYTFVVQKLYINEPLLRENK